MKLFIFFAIISVCWNSFRYIKSSGDDTGDCNSEQLPCRTFQYTQDHSNENDTIFFLSDYKEELIVIVRKGLIITGVSQSYVIFHIIVGNDNMTIKFQNLEFKNYYRMEETCVIVFVEQEGDGVINELTFSKIKVNNNFFQKKSQSRCFSFTIQARVMNLIFDDFIWKNNNSTNTNIIVERIQSTWITNKEKTIFNNIRIENSNADTLINVINVAETHFTDCIFENISANYILQVYSSSIILSSKSNELCIGENNFVQMFMDNVIFRNLTFATCIYLSNILSAELKIIEFYDNNGYTAFFCETCSIISFDNITFNENGKKNPAYEYILFYIYKAATLEVNNFNAKNNDGMSIYTIDVEYVMFENSVFQNMSNSMGIISVQGNVKFVSFYLVVFSEIDLLGMSCISVFFYENDFYLSILDSYFEFLGYDEDILDYTCSYSNPFQEYLLAPALSVIGPNNPFFIYAPILPMFTIQNTEFFSNKGVLGGSIYFSNIDMDHVSFHDVLCMMNKAKYGGCLYSVRKLDICCTRETLNLISSTWTGNYAEKAGGNLFFDRHIEVFYNKEDFWATSDGYGNVVAATAKHYYILNLEREESGKMELYSYNNKTEITIIETYPGELLLFSFQTIDSYDQVINKKSSFEQFSFVYDEELENLAVISPNSDSDENEMGLIVFPDIEVRGNGSFIRINFTSSLLNFQFWAFGFNVTECPARFRYDEIDGKKDICQKCQIERYKLFVGNVNCLNCPIGSICEEGEIFAEEGYCKIFFFLNVSNEGLLVEEKIAKPMLCLGECERDKCGSRGKNFTLPLCESCDIGWSKFGEKCVECNGSFGNYLFFIFFFIFSFFMFLILLFFFANSVGLTSYTGSYIFFIQSLFIIRKGEFNVYEIKIEKYYPWTKGFFITVGIFQTIVNYLFNNAWIELSEIIFTLGEFCPYPFSSYIIMFSKSFMMIGSFLFLLIILGFVKLFNFIKKKLSKRKKDKKFGLIQNLRIISGKVDSDDEDYFAFENATESQEEEFKDKSPELSKKKKISRVIKKVFHLIKLRFGLSEIGIIKSLVYLFDIIYEVLSECISVFFKCKDFGPFGRRIVKYTDVKCFDGYWFGWSVYYFVLGLFVVLSPLMIFIFLKRNKKNLHKKVFIEKYGELYEIYNHKFYWYYFYQLIKKFLIVFVQFLTTIVVPEYSYEVSFLIISLLLLMFIFIQYIIRPFHHKYENFIELFSLFMLLVITMLRTGAVKSNSIPIFVVNYLLYVFSMIFFASTIIFAGFGKRVFERMRNYIKEIKKREKDENSNLEEELLKEEENLEVIQKI